MGKYPAILIFACMANAAFGQDALPETIVAGGISATEADLAYYGPGNHLLKVTSQPAGIVAHETIVADGAVATTPLVPLQISYLQFAYLSENGQPLLSQSGLPLRQVSLEMQQDRHLMAVYLAGHVDADNDGLVDWREWRYFGSMDLDASSDPDGDGYTIGEERRLNLSILLKDQPRPGGLSATEATFDYYTADYRVLEVSSDPTGMIGERFIVPLGSPQTTPLAELSVGGYEFAYWAENGVPFLSEAGRPLRQVTLDMQQNHNLVANYFISYQDTDGDWLADWQEWRYFGTQDLDLSSDPDNDGYSIGDEQRLNLSILLPDHYVRGGLSATEALGYQVYLPLTEQPMDLSGNAGGTGILQAATSAGEASYQWYRANADFSETAMVEGATSPSLEVTFEEGTFWYWVEVTVPGGSQTSRPANVYGFGGLDPDSLTIRLLESNEDFDRIELSVSDDSIAADRPYSVFISQDLQYWMRLESDIQVSNREALTRFRIARVEGPVFFKFEEYQYTPLSEEEVARETNRLSTAIDTYTAALKTDLLVHPLSTPEDEATIDTLVTLLHELIATMPNEERALFVEGLYNAGLMDRMEAVSTFNLPEAPAVESYQEARPLSYDPMATPIEDDRWDWVRAARGWHVHAEGIKAAATIESTAAILAGPQSVITIGVIGTLSELGNITFNTTPSCPTKIYAFTEARTDNLVPGQEPYPTVEFFADFESKTALDAELVTFGVNTLTKKLIKLYYSTKTTVADRQYIDNFFDEILNETESWTAQQAYSKLTEKLNEYLTRFSEKETWNAVQFDPDYWGGAFTWNNFADDPNSRSPAIYDFETREIFPREPGSGKVVFYLNDTLCKVKLNTALPFKVVDEIPVIGDPGGAYLSNGNTAISVDLSIEDERPEDLILTTLASHGTATWADGVLTYRPNTLDLNQVTIQINSSETRFGDIVASFGGIQDQVELTVSDGANDPVSVLIPIDLSPLLAQVQINLGSPEPGMLSRFEKWDAPVIDTVAGTLTQTVAARAASDYAGQGGTVPYSASLGSLSAESLILLFATPTDLLVYAGPDIVAEDEDGDGVETVIASGEATPPEGATVTAWNWSWSGGSVNGQTLEADFPVGQTLLRLTVTDSFDNEAYDSTWVTVNPSSTSLVARAGEDVEVQDVDNAGWERVLLDASTSGGTIVSWEWSWPTGSASGESIEADFSVGKHEVTLTITDDQGAQSTDTVLVRVTYGCAPETRPDLMPLTLPLREIYGDVSMRFGATTFDIGPLSGQWTYTQGTNCNPGLLILTYDRDGNDRTVYYEKISLLGGYAGTYVFQIYENGQIVETRTGTYQ